MSVPKRIKYIKLGLYLFAKVSGEWYKTIISSNDKLIYLIGGQRVAKPEKEKYKE